MDEDQFVVSVWYHSSETGYTYGPFKEEDAEAFVDRCVLRNDKVGSIMITVLNAPETFGTGLEMS